MSTTGCRFEARADGALAVSGVLTFDTAKEAWLELRGRVADASAKVLDLSAVERSDSAGLACVLAVLADAGKRGQRLKVSGLPAGMRRLAQVCEVEPLLAAD
ncbi:MAG: sulfate transporter [Lysobacterales bacterium 14-68-21]|nr:MAG: sulfate transporter [Xanthomonadales bacterium 15-68-25]OZB68326.1 MAG: sulfate transporter [Xanthomonadales bacterium 14-68-21]